MGDNRTTDKGANQVIVSIVAVPAMMVVVAMMPEVALLSPVVPV